MSRKRIGELLLDRGAITREQLAAGLTAQQRTRQRLGVTLIQAGSITEVQLAQVLAQSLGLATVDLTQVQVDWSAVHMLRARFCEKHELFPFAIDGKGTTKKRVMVAMSDPLDESARKEIEFTTGLEVSPYVSTHSQIRAAVLRYYHKVSEAHVKQAGPLVGGGGSVVLEPVEEAAPSGEVLVGEEIISKDNLVPTVPADPGARKRTVTRDLDFLFGGRPADDDGVEKLEQKFWVLLQLLAKKNIVSREEFLKALGEEE